jgi:hypothetical protein
MAERPTTIDSSTVAPLSRVAWVRLPGSLAARLDAHHAAMRAQMPAVTVTRSDAIRELLAFAFDTLDATRTPTARGGAR